MLEPQEMIKEIERLTGRSAEEWIALLPADAYAARG